MKIFFFSSLLLTILCFSNCKEDSCELNFSQESPLATRYHFDNDSTSFYYNDSILAYTYRVYSETWRSTDFENCPKCCSGMDFCKYTFFSIRNLKSEKVIAKFNFLDTTKWIEIPPLGSIEPGIPSCEKGQGLGRVLEFKYE
jgi:hypothetical protein